MIGSCPNVYSAEWKALVNDKTIGAQRAYMLFVANNYQIPTVEEAKNILYDKIASPLQRVRTIYSPRTLEDRVNMFMQYFYEEIEKAKEENPSLQDTIEVLGKDGKNANEIFNNIIFNIKEERDLLKEEYPEVAYEYQKILDNIDGILEEAMNVFKNIEGFTFNINTNALYKVLQTNENDLGISQNNQLYEETTTGEEQTKEGWMNNFRYISVEETLTAKVKRFLWGLSEKDSQGEDIIDDLGLPRKINVPLVRNTLLETISSLSEIDDVTKLLQNKLNSNKTKYSWIQNLLDEFEKDPYLRTHIKVNFNKTFTPMIAIRTTGEKGVEIINTNASNASKWYKTQWQTILQQGIIFNKGLSIYKIDKNGSVLDKKGIETVIKEVLILYKGLTSANDSSLIEENIPLIGKFLNSIGVSFNSIEDLKSALLEEGEYSLEKTTKLVLKIGQIVKSAENLLKKNEVVPAVNIMLDNNGAYTEIAKLFYNPNDTYSESMSNENGKSKYSYRYTSALGELIKLLNNTNGTKEQFEQMIFDKFQKYKGYYNTKSDQFYNEWINLLTGKSDEFINHPDVLKLRDLQAKKDKMWELSQKYRDMFKYVSVDHIDKIEFSDMTDVQYLKAQLIAFFSTSKNRDIAYYAVPTLSNSPEFGLIQFKRYIGSNYKEEILKSLKNQVFAEYHRIKEVQRRKKAGLPAIDNFDKRGSQFLSFPAFNVLINEETGAIKYFDDIALEKDDNIRLQKSIKLDVVIDDILTKSIDDIVKTNLEWFSSIGVTIGGNNSELPNIAELEGSDEHKREMLENYLWNYVNYMNNFINLTVGDQAFFKHSEDFNKRIKMIYAPGESLDTKAVFRYFEKDGTYTDYGPETRRAYERVMTLKDNVIESSVYNEIKDFIQAKIDRGELKQEDGDKIVESYKRVNETDAQGYRSLASAMDIMRMAGKSSQALERAYRHLSKGIWNIKDYNIFFTNFKPFTSGFASVNTGTDNEGKQEFIRTPIQHKTSEVILIPINTYAKSRNSKIAAITEFMKGEKDSKGNILREPVDLILFESAIKTGAHSKINLNTVKSYDDTFNALKESEKKGEYQDIAWENYRIQQPVNEHLQTTKNLYGTQVMKLLFESLYQQYNLVEEQQDKFSLNNSEIPFSQLSDKYDAIWNEKLLNGLFKLLNKFGSIKNIKRIIEDEVKSNPRYPNDYLDAVQLVDYLVKEGKDIGKVKKRLALPLFHPTQRIRTQQLLYSIIVRETTKQKISGGVAVDITQFGMDNPYKLFDETNSLKGEIDSLEKQIKNNPDNKEKLEKQLKKIKKEFKRASETLNLQQSNPAVKEKEDKLNIVWNKDENGNPTSISHYEAYLPFWQKKYFSFLADGSGDIDITKIDDSALRMVGYRIPSESHYSMMPMKIVGFLPENGGNNVVLPSEVTTIAGLDFDKQ